MIANPFFEGFKSDVNEAERVLRSDQVSFPKYLLSVRHKTCLGQTHAKFNCQIWEAVSHIAHCFHDLFFFISKDIRASQEQF